MSGALSRWFLDSEVGYFNVMWVQCNNCRSAIMLSTIVSDAVGAIIGGSQSEIAKCTLTHWGQVTHICVGKLTNIGSDNGLSPGRRQTIIWTNAGILLIGPLGTNFSEFLVVFHTFSFNKMHLKMSSAKWRPFCLGLNVLIRSMDGQAAVGARMWASLVMAKLMYRMISQVYFSYITQVNCELTHWPLEDLAETVSNWFQAKFGDCWLSSTSFSR